MIRKTTIRQYSTRWFDIDKIRTVANNPELDESQVFDFGSFIIARSGRNHNATEITPEGQKEAVDKWIGKAILFEDHKLASTNQIGRIYESWIVDENGETVTKGRGYGIITEDHKDLFARIKNRIHSELSCGYEPVRSLCSVCDSELDIATSTCPKGHEATEDFYVRDVEFLPHHLSFTGNPAVEGAGLVANSSQGASPREYVGKPSLSTQVQDRLHTLARDGELFRKWSEREFRLWYKRNNPATPEQEIQSLADRLSAKEMLTFANVEEERFREALGSGQQLSKIPEEPVEADDLREYQTPEEIIKNMKGRG